MRTFILLTDFSQNAKHAAEYAAQLALKRGAHLELVHIFEAPVPVSEAELATMHFQNMSHRILEELEEEKERLVEKYGTQLEISCKIYEQPLIDRIEDLFQPSEVKLIIIGLTGSGMNNFFFGSNTLNIVQNVGCRILTVPPYTSFRPIKNILFAFNSLQTPPSVIPVEKLRKILSIFNARLSILEVNPELPSTDSQEEEKTLNHLFHSIPHSYHQIKKKNIPAAIKDFIKEEQSDLIAIIPKKKDFWESLLGANHTKSMLFHSDTPILSIPAKEK